MDFTIGLVTSATTVFAFYPLRDFVKHYPVNVDGQFVIGRYKGLATNPSQLALLALPNALMLSVSGTGAVPSIVVASLMAGFSRRFLRTLVYRLGERTGSRAGTSVYSGQWDAVVKATSNYGFMSWFVGGTAASCTQFLSSGLALASLGGVGVESGRRRYRKADPAQAFLYDWWYMFRAHAFFTMLTAPVRNGLNAAMYIPTRGGSQIGPAQWASSEAQIYKEAALISKRMLQDMGIRYFFQGTIRSVLKVSLPFGFNYALYKYVSRRVS